MVALPVDWLVRSGEAPCKLLAGLHLSNRELKLGELSSDGDNSRLASRVCATRSGDELLVEQEHHREVVDGSELVNTIGLPPSY